MKFKSIVFFVHLSYISIRCNVVYSRRKYSLIVPVDMVALIKKFDQEYKYTIYCSVDRIAQLLNFSQVILFNRKNVFSS